MKIELRNRYSGSVITIQEVDDNEQNPLKAVAIQAVSAGVSLKFADLRGADLRGADLRGADLRGADLRDADLRDAFFSGTDLSGANFSSANLTNADLSGAEMVCAFLSGTNLNGTDLIGANLRGASLIHVDWGDVDIPVIDNIHQRVYEAASQPGALDMGDWHTCKTTHCRAGWAIVLAGKQGRKLEEKYGQKLAAYMIYSKSDPKMWEVPDFHCSDAEALEDMRKMSGREL